MIYLAWSLLLFLIIQSFQLCYGIFEYYVKAKYTLKCLNVFILLENCVMVNGDRSLFFPNKKSLLYCTLFN